MAAAFRSTGAPSPDRAEHLRRQERAAWWSLVESMQTLAAQPLRESQADLEFARERVINAKAAWGEALGNLDAVLLT